MAIDAMSLVAVLVPSLAVLVSGSLVWNAHRALARERRQRAELERLLTGAERSLRDVEDVASVGSWRLDIAGGVLRWSAKHFELFGLPQTQSRCVDAEAAIGMIQSDDVAEVRRQYAAIRESGAPMNVIYRVRRGDGSWRVLQARARAVNFDGDGRVLTVVGTAQEITAQHEAAERLKDSERRYRLLFELSPLPMWTYDRRDWRITDANHAAVEAYGYSRAELLSRTVLQMHPSEEQERVEEMLKARSWRPGAGDRRWHHLKASGRRIAVDIYGQDAPFEGAHCRLVCLVDRTAEETSTLELQRLNARLEATVEERTEALARREEHYRALADLSPQVIWQADAQGSTTYLNPVWYRIFGEREGGWLGWRWMDVVHPDDLPETRQAVEKALRDHTPLHNKRRMRDRSGAYRTFLGVTTPVLRPDGSVAGWIGVDTDISEVERQSRRLEQLNAELESFSYSVSHDLRAPVQVIKGFLDAVLDGQAGTVDDTARGYLERARRNARRMDELISDMLTLARLSREPLHLERFDVAAKVRNLVETIQERHPLQLIECAVPSHAEIVADRRLIKTMLENLMDNAAKFSRERLACRMEFTVRDEPGHVVLSLCDDGVGFPQEHAHRLFRPFQRLHDQKRFAGTGIGLAIVSRIAELHGGSVTGRNRETGGAVFEVRLPFPNQDGEHSVGTPA